MPSPPKKVLIVEDNLILSLLEERLLTNMGHNVVGKVTSGEKAVELFKKLEPDFVIMDISLSGKMDGFEATNIMRETTDVPVIFVSGNSDRYEKFCLKKEGFNEFVSKPFTYQDLADPINRIWNDSPAEVQETEKQY